MKRTTRISGMWRCLILPVALTACHLTMLSQEAKAQQETVRTAPEPMGQQPPESNWFNADTPGKAALARPDSFLPYGSGPSGSRGDGCCQDCHPQGCCLKKLLIWATYCPKQRVGCSSSFCCNSCTYKGVLPFYYFFLNPKCVEGTGLHATFNNACYRGCNGCGAQGTCGKP